MGQMEYHSYDTDRDIAEIHEMRYDVANGHIATQ